MKVALGLGCDRNTPMVTVERVIQKGLHKLGLTFEDVEQVATIDLKKDETGLIELSKKYGWKIKFYRADELAKVKTPNPSATVMKYTGTGSVSEAAALLVADTSMKNLLLAKLKHKGADGRNATVSIAGMKK